MPKYLAIDYFSQAVQERQNKLCRMLLAVPHHLECIDNYAHKGRKDDQLYGVPWERELPEKVIPRTPKDDLSQITSGLSKLECFSEYSPAPSEAEFIPSSNPDSPPINFDIWSDFEVEVVNYLVESFQPNDVEEFTVDSSAPQSQDENLLEEQSCVDYMTEDRDKMPSVSALCSRLKPKVVQDPLTDDKGNPISEQNIVSRRDNTFTLTDKELLERKQVFKETFILQRTETYEDGTLNDDKALELPCSPSNPVHKRNDSSDMLHETLMHIQKEDGSSKDIKSTINEVQLEDIMSGDETKSFLESLQFPQEDQSRKLDFVTMNMQGSSDKENSQLCLDAKFESPLITMRDEATTTPEQKLSCGHLSLMDTSPVNQICQVISPSSKTKMKSKIWQNEKVFNDILIKILPVPNIPDQKTSVITIPNQILGIQREEIKGDLELQLPWDPLAESHCLSSIRNKLSKVESFSHKRHLKRNSTNVLIETFKKVTIEDENMASPTCTTLVNSNKVPHKSTSKTKITFHENEKKPKESAMRVPILSATENSFKPKENKVWTTRQQSMEDTFSSLDDFLMLRSMQQTARNAPSSSCFPPKTIVKAAKIRPTMAPSSADKNEVPSPNKCIDSDHGDKMSEKCTAKPENVKETKTMVSIQISPEYQEVIEFLSGSVHPFLARLKENGIINQDRDIKDLTPDYTRFAVKQVEMSLADDKDPKIDEQELTYKLAVCLHILVGALELLVHCGMGVALAHLSHSQEKYADLLGNTVESIRRHLFNAHFKFQQNSILHPKIVKILDTIRQWMREDSKNINNNNNKVVIIAYRHTDYLYRELRDILSSFGGIRVSVLLNSQEDLTSCSNNNSDVVVANMEALIGEFPWHIFSYVIEYETKTTSEVSLSSKQEVKEHISLVMDYAAKELTDKVEARIAGKIEGNIKDQYIFIGSTKVISNIKLLHLLEGRNNIMIYERDYSSLLKSKKDSHKKMNLQPDLLIDERTCIVIEDLASLNEQEEYEKLRDLVLSLSLKCLKCYVIVCCESTTLNGKDKFCNHLSMLYANAAHFTHTKSMFQLEILYCNTVEEVAIWIRRIGDLTRQTSKAWDQEEWIKRKWLTDEMTVHERFLLSFPCMNSFSAQVMLTAASLPRLLTMSLSELISTCPWIPESVLNMFFHTTHLTSSATTNPRDPHPTTPGYLSRDPCHTTSITSHHTRTPSIKTGVGTAITLDEPLNNDRYTSTANSINNSTPMSNASDDSLWMAIQNDQDCLQDPACYGTNTTDLGINRDYLAYTSPSYTSHNQEKTPFIRDNITTKKQQNERNYISGQEDTEILSASNFGLEHDRLPQSYTKQLFDLQDNAQRFSSNNSHHQREATRNQSSPRPVHARDTGILDQLFNFHKNTERVSTEDHRVSTKNNGSGGEALGQEGSRENIIPMFQARKGFNSSFQRRDVADSDYQYSEIDTTVNNHQTTSGYTNKPSYSEYFQKKTVGSGSRFSSATKYLDSFDHLDTDNYHGGQEYAPGTSLVFNDLSRNQQSRRGREDLLYKTPSFNNALPHKLGRKHSNGVFQRNSERSSTSTNVGVAQPLRRSQEFDMRKDGRVVVTDPFTKYNQNQTIAGPNYDKATPMMVPKPRKALKEHVVPCLEPSPDEYMNDLSIFSISNQNPTKKPRLTYERVPGAKGGQTKLAFC